MVFKYKQKIKFLHGFYKGATGIVVGRQDRDCGSNSWSSILVNIDGLTELEFADQDLQELTCKHTIETTLVPYCVFSKEYVSRCTKCDAITQRESA